jgi:hypothetical protein
MPFRNTDPDTLNVDTAVLNFKKKGDTLVNGGFEVTRTDSIDTVYPETSDTVTFNVNVKNDAATGDITIDGSMTYTNKYFDVQATDTAANDPDSWLVQSRPQLKLTRIVADSETVSQGQDFVRVRVGVKNDGDAAARALSDTLTFNHTSEGNVTSEYTVTPTDSFNTLDGFTTDTFVYRVGLDNNATTGPVDIEFSLTGADTNTGETVQDFDVDNPDSWTVRSPAELTVLRSNNQVESVGVGREDLIGSLIVKNAGGATLNLDTGSLSFVHEDNGNVDPQYTIVDDTVPASVGGGETTTVEVQFNVTGGADTGLVEMGGTVKGFDANTHMLTQDSATPNRDTFNVLPPGELSIIEVSAPKTVYTGQSNITVKVPAKNVGGADVTLDTATLTMADTTGTTVSDSYSITRTDSVDILKGDETDTLTFDVSVKSRAATGVVTIDAVLDAMDPRATDTNALKPDTWTVESPAFIQVREVKINDQDTVVRGETGVTVSVRMKNTGSHVAKIDSSYLLVTNASPTYRKSVEAETIPAEIGAYGTDTATFEVGIDDELALDDLTIDAAVLAHDSPTMRDASDTYGDTVETVEVLNPAKLIVEKVTADSTLVTQGQDNLNVQLDVKNKGDVAGILEDHNLHFTDRKGNELDTDYAVTATDTFSKVETKTTETLRYEVDVSDTAQPVTVDIGGTLAAKDRVTGDDASDTTSPTPDTWTVQTPPDLRILNVTVHQSEIEITDTFTLEVDVENFGMETARIDTSYPVYLESPSDTITSDYYIIDSPGLKTLAGNSDTTLEFVASSKITADTQIEVRTEFLVEGTGVNAGYSRRDVRAITSDTFFLTANQSPPVLQNLSYPSLTNEDTATISGYWDEPVDGTVVGESNSRSYTNQRSFSATIDLPVKKNVITISGTNVTGKMSDTFVTVVHDTQGPELQVLSPSGDTVGNEEIFVGGQTNGETVYVNGSFTPKTTENDFGRNVSYSVGEDSIKEVTVSVKSFDNAGNTTTVDRTLWIDNKPPLITVTSPSDTSDRTKEDTYPVRGYLNEDGNLQIDGTSTFLSEESGQYNFDRTVSLDGGRNAVKLTANDEFNNQSSRTIYLTKDLDTPPINILSPNPGERLDERDITLQGQTDTDVDEVSINGRSIGVDDEGGFTFVTTLDTGQQNFDVRLQDSVGNKNDTTVTFYYAPYGKIYITDVQTVPEVIRGQDSVPVAVEVINKGKTRVDLTDAGNYLRAYEDPDAGETVTEWRIRPQNNPSVIDAGSRQVMNHRVDVPDSGTISTVYLKKSVRGSAVGTSETTRDTAMIGWPVRSKMNLKATITKSPTELQRKEGNGRVQIMVKNKDDRKVKLKGSSITLVSADEGGSVTADYNVAKPAIDEPLASGDTLVALYGLKATKDAPLGPTTLDATFVGTEQASEADVSVSTASGDAAGFLVISPAPMVEVEKNYPNPADPREHPVKIQYELGQPADVDLNIYTLSGELVKSFDIPAGQKGARTGENTLEWFGRNDMGRTVASGGYIYRLQAQTNSGEEVIDTGKIAILKQ